MDFILTSKPNPGSILQIKFIDVQDVVSIPDPDSGNNIDYTGIVLVGGKSWNSFIPMPRTGILELDSIDTDHGQFEQPKISFSDNDTTKSNVNKINTYLSGRYILIVKDGSGQQYLVGSLERWLRLKYKHNSQQSRAQIQVIDLEFSFS